MHIKVMSYTLEFLLRDLARAPFVSRVASIRSCVQGRLQMSIVRTLEFTIISFVSRDM